MMAQVRVLRGSRVQTVGQPVGVQVSTFRAESVEGISGEDLEPIIADALGIPFRQVEANWPVDTGASVETLRIESDEVGIRHARVSLRIGGQPLIEDPRNKKHIDYAPFIEFNGSPGGTPPGTILYAMTSTDREVRAVIHEGVRRLLQERLRGHA